MATLNRKIKKYLKNNSKTYEAERKNYVLQNDGSGDYIKSWNVSDLTEPTADQLANCDAAANTSETLNVVLSTRKKEYKDFGHQLDLLYHDMTAGKLDNSGEWHKHIKAVKDANSKE